MAESESKKLPSSLPLIAAVATIVAAVLISHRPLESSRPSPPSGLEPAVHDFNGVDAALWQDPFEVALDHIRDFHCGVPSGGRSVLRPCSSDHCISQVGQRINRTISAPRRSASTNPAVHILMVMVRDERLAEDHERRLRNRYAVLTALRASGMEPEDGRHVHYFTVSPEDWEWAPRPIAFPCEWFKQEWLSTIEPDTDHRPEHALVIWLPQSAFEGQPLRRIARLLKGIGGCMPEPRLFDEMWKPDGLVRVDLIGPSFSTVLRDMLNEIQEAKGDLVSPLEIPACHSDAPWLRIYSPWATASPALLVKNWHSRVDGNVARPDRTRPACMLQVIPKVFQEAHVDFIRMIGTDDLLAMHIINELERRGVNVIAEPGKDDEADQVVLISEWDTFYGKAFPLTFAAMMSSLEDGTGAVDRQVCDPTGLLERLCQSRQREPDWITYSENLVALLHDPNRLPENLHLYTYLNGIDGRMPKAQGQTAEATAAVKTATPSKWAYSENLELPIGQGQLDYARRLAQRLHDEFGGLKRRRLKAIGVVGSDVYDKLILLHALRERFGNTLLFTTDLDARLLHHEQFKWTHNVIVASNFGLELHHAYYTMGQASPKSLHGKEGSPSSVSPPFPPFRENYQTALFLACRTALGLREGNEEEGRLLRDLKSEDLTALLSHPRIFEVGRRSPVDLSLSQDSEGLHPLPKRWESKPERVHSLSLLFVCLGFITLLWLPLARGLQEIAHWGCQDLHKDGSRRGRRRVAIGRPLAIVLPVFVFIGLIIHDHYAQPDGEPFSLVSGVSAWPGLAVWLAAILVGFYFARSSLAIVADCDRRIYKDFRLKDPERIRLRTSTSRRGHRLGGPRPRNWLLPNFGKAMASLCQRDQGRKSTTAQKETVKPVRAQSLWVGYVVRGSLHRRVVRTVRASALFFAVTLILMWLFGYPSTPCRGVLSCFLYKVLGLFVLSLLLFLLFFAIDAISLCLQMIGPLIAHETIWPRDRTPNRPINRMDPWSDREGWMDVRFIARMTESVGKLLYMPSIILLLVIAGRFWYFDGWGYSFQVVFVYAVIALWLGICAVALLFAAKWARAVALDNLAGKLRTIGFGVCTSKMRAERIKAMIEDIRSIRQGAFRPLAENPVLHFLLIPSGGVGLLTLLTYVLPT